jgi:transaldolase
MANPVKELYERQRQSPWLDFIRRNMLNDGGLRRYVEEDGLRGVTANPTIFAQAIGAGNDYDAEIAELVRQGVQPHDLFEHIAISDLRHATTSCGRCSTARGRLCEHRGVAGEGVRDAAVDR